MTEQPYSYDKKYSTRYTFVSKGKHGAINKVVEFLHTSNKLILNLAFGDLKNDGTIDDTANSNNGDIIKVMATIIHVVRDFTNEYPEYKIIFTGSTAQRTKLYQRILKTYYSAFNQEFDITALEEVEKNKYEEVIFEPMNNLKNYVAFFVKRKK
jgi:hypothetical protein